MEVGDRRRRERSARRRLDEEAGGVRRSAPRRRCPALRHLRGSDHPGVSSADASGSGRATRGEAPRATAGCRVGPQLLAAGRRRRVGVCGVRSPRLHLTARTAMASPVTRRAPRWRSAPRWARARSRRSSSSARSSGEARYSPAGTPSSARHDPARPPRRRPLHGGRPSLRRGDGSWVSARAQRDADLPGARVGRIRAGVRRARQAGRSRRRRRLRRRRRVPGHARRADRRPEDERLSAAAPASVGPRRRRRHPDSRRRLPRRPGRADRRPEDERLPERP